MQQTLDAVHAAAEEKDLQALIRAMDTLSAEVGSDNCEAAIRAHVLPRLSLRGLMWFWKQISSPIQQSQLLCHLSTRTVKALLDGGYEFGKDFSFAEAEDGNSRLMLNANAKKHLELTMSTDKLISLALLTRRKHVTQ